MFKKFGCALFLVAFFLGVGAVYAGPSEIPKLSEFEMYVTAPGVSIFTAKDADGRTIIVVTIRGKDAKALAQQAGGDALYSEEDSLVVLLDVTEEI